MMKPPKKILLDSRHTCGLNLVLSLIFLGWVEDLEVQMYHGS